MLDSVVKDGEEAYIRLFDELLKLGSPYIDNFDQADRGTSIQVYQGQNRQVLRQ